MKLNQVKQGSKVYIKKIVDEKWKTYTTKENKVYDHDDFSYFEPEMGFDARTIKVLTPSETYEVDIRRDEYVLMRDWDTGWEMLVKNQDVKLGVNISDDH